MEREVYERLTKTNKDCQELGVLMARDYRLFIEFMFYGVSGSSFVFKGFHEEIIREMQLYGEGKNERKNLIINVAPRSGKSTIVKYFVAWGLARNPRSNFLYTSYADSLVNAMSDGVRGIITSEIFKRCYPHIQINPRKDAKDNWGIKDFGGEMYASPMGGRLTGFGAGILGYEGFSGSILVDDYLKAQSAGSVVEKERVIEYYSETLKNRVNNPRVPIIIIAQRLAVDDLVGWIESTPSEAKDYRIIKVPACDEDGHNSIWTEQWPDDYFVSMKESRPHYFYSQYMQNPVIKGGSVIKVSHFKGYNHLEGIRFKRCFITADTAMTIREHSDYSVFCCWGIDSYNNLYLLDMYRDKVEADRLLEEAIKFWGKWRSGINGTWCSCFFVEEKSSGIYLVQLLQNKTGIPVIGMKAVKDKLTRIELGVDFISAGKVYLPTFKEEIVREFKTECEQFNRQGTAPHDDIVDCLAYAICLVSSGYGIAAHAIL